MRLIGEGNEKFSVNALGEISVIKQLDFETQAGYNLQAIASSPYGDSQPANVYITVGDVDELANAGVGIWSDAQVKIYKVEDNGTRTLMFTETTSTGVGYEDIGRFDSHRLELEAERFYVYEVTGGQEHDSDQDGEIDASPTENLGTIHAVLKGSWVRHLEDQLNITLITELYYQYAVLYGLDYGNFEVVEAALINRNNPVSTEVLARNALTFNPRSNTYWNTKYQNQIVMNHMTSLMYAGDKRYSLYAVNSLMISDGWWYVKSNSSYLNETDSEVYVTAWKDNLFDLGTLSPLGTAEIFKSGFDISKDQNYIASIESVGEANYDLTIYDFTDPENISLLSNTNVDYIYGFKFTNLAEKIFLIDGYRETHMMYAVDTSNKNSPSARYEAFSTPGYIADFVISDDDQWMYVADRFGGLQIVDIHSDPMEIVGNYMTYGLVEEIKVVGNQAVIKVVNNLNSFNLDNDRNATIEIVDITDKTNPVLSSNIGGSHEYIEGFGIDSSLETLYVHNKGYNPSYYNNIEIYQKIDGEYQWVSSIEAPSWGVENIYVYDNNTKILIIGDYGDIFIYDVSDKYFPSLINTYISPNKPA